jgi:hypothetical protein
VWHLYVKQQTRKESRFVISLGSNKINELIVSSNKLTNNLAGLVTSFLESGVACGPPVGLRSSGGWTMGPLTAAVP